MAKRYGLSSMLVFLCIILCASSAWARWARNGVLVCGEPYVQTGQRIISDGSHGATMIWMDYRSNTNWDIYGNRVDPDGNIEPGGVPICTADGDQVALQFIPDGTGGGIITWQDYRDGQWDIYAQWVDGTGTARWADNGLLICGAAGDQTSPFIVPDGGGGAIIIWEDYRDGQYDIYGQRITSDGDTLWAANGKPIDASVGDQSSMNVAPDSSGGAIIVWDDTRNGDWEIYGQRIDNNGDPMWGSDAIPIRGMYGYAFSPKLGVFPGGSACVSWSDYRNGYNDIYAQKIDSDGSMLWQIDGLPICAFSSNKYDPQGVDDGSGGAIFVWGDDRDGVNVPVYAQRIDADGNLAWQQNGVMLFPVYGNGAARLIMDGSGGIIAVLDMYEPLTWGIDIYAQRLDHDGNTLWGPKGAPVCLATNLQYNPDLASDGRGGAIAVWEDYRPVDGYSDIYCQRISPSGLWGEPEPKVVSCLDVPHDQGGWLRIKTRASALDALSETETPIFGYNVWRLIGGAGPFAASSGASATPALDRSKLIALLSDPATANGVRVSGSQAVALGLPEGEWEAVAFWFATRDTMYSVAVPTKNDSTEAGTTWEDYIVTAHTTTAGIFAASEPTGGYSVDNLAPALTTGFAGAETASPHGLALTWTRNSASDLWKYDIYRGDGPLFVPDESNRIGTTDGTYLFDAGWVKAYQYFYKLVAVDRHGNKSPEALVRPEDINVGTMLQSFAASLEGSVVEISWTLSEAGADVRFSVLRAETPGGAFEKLAAPAIVRDGLSFTLSDKSCEPGMTYRYRIDVVDEAGSRTLFETDAISTPAMPLTLNQNHPNPFNPSTTISYYLPAASEVTLDVYDSSGRLVSRLVDGATQERGTHEVAWRGVDTAGRQASSGVYFYRLVSGKETISKKMVLLR